MSVLAVVDTPAAVARVQADLPDARIATDNPLLAASSPDGTVENIDRLVGQDHALELGRAALEITAGIERRLAADDAAGQFGLPPGNLALTGPLSRLVASVLHRGAVLARALDAFAPDRVALALIDLPAWEPRQPLMLPRFASPARPLAELGFFAQRPVEFVAVPAPLPERVNDTAVRDLGRRLAMMPAAQIAGEVLARLASPPRTAVVVGQENEALRETLPWLRLAGIRAKRAGHLVAPAKGAPAAVEPTAEDTAFLQAALGTSLAAALEALGEFDSAQRDAIVALFLRHLAAGLVHLAGRQDELRLRVEALFPRPGGILLSNGLFGPAGMLVHRFCRQRGVKVVEFEHGVTAGLAALTDTKIEQGGPSPAERLLVCSDRAVHAFDGGADGPARVVGLPDQVRSTLRRPLQRRLARRALGLGSGPVVMHVSTLPYFGNQRPGLGAPTETATFTLDRTLIEEVYPRLPHRVVFKQYPTQRFPFEPGYDALFRVAPNLTIRKDEDFRYIRAAADVLVTMTPTSTLGWCVGAGVPLVWLDSRRINPLDGEELRAEFAAAFLFVDLDEADWPDRLAALLSRPLAAIRTDWGARRPARERLYADAITGPSGSVGRRAARLVAEIVRREGAGFAQPVAREAET